MLIIANYCFRFAQTLNPLITLINTNYCFRFAQTLNFKTLNFQTFNFSPPYASSGRQALALKSETVALMFGLLSDGFAANF